MKKIIFVLLVALFVPAVQAVAIEGQTASRREAMLRRYAPKISSAQALLRAAQEGDVSQIATLTQAAFLLETDKFGNNCFHLAKNADTVQALAAAARRLEPNYLGVIVRLRNQRNQAGETPLMRHINYGKADTFTLLYEGSELAAAVRDARRVDKGGALSATAEIKKGVAISLSKDGAARTVAQAALANAQAPGMNKVVEFFKKNAPYLF